MDNNDEKIVVRKKQFDPYAYLFTVLAYAKFDLSYQKRLAENRMIPLTAEEQEYFFHMVQHLSRAQGVVEELRILNQGKSTKLKVKDFLKRLWPFSRS